MSVSAEGVQTGPATADDRPLRIVVVAMKPMLRGRIRRNVMTFLELGAEVTVVNTPPRDDFFQGLESPRLHTRFVEARSAAVRYQAWMSRQNVLRKEKWARQREEARAKAKLPVPIAPAWMLANNQLASLAYRGWTSSQGIRVRTVVEEWWPPLKKKAIKRGRELRKRRDLTIRDGLKKFHLVNRFVEFWFFSPDDIVALDPDLIVSSDLPGLVGANLAARRLGRPHLHDCHELYLESTTLKRYERLLLWPVERHYMRRADAIVIVNQTIRDEYKRRYGVDGVVLRNCAPLVPASVRADPIDIRGLLGLAPKAHVVLYQGGLMAGRGLDVCVRAAKYFPDDAHLVFVGEGREKEGLVMLADEVGVRDRVHWLPAVPPAELPAYTAAASVGLIPYQPVSKNNMYALPNKVFEYTGAGVPFVASDLPELRRIVQATGCGEVYDPFNAANLAEAVTAVLQGDRHGIYRSKADKFGRDNSWESERKVLIERTLVLAATGRRTQRATKASRSGESAGGVRGPCYAGTDMSLRDFSAWCRLLLSGEANPPRYPTRGDSSTRKISSGRPISRTEIANSVDRSAVVRNVVPAAESPPVSKISARADHHDASRGELEHPAPRLQAESLQADSSQHGADPHSWAERCVRPWTTASAEVPAGESAGPTTPSGGTHDESPDSVEYTLATQVARLKGEVTAHRDRAAALHRQIAASQGRLAASVEQIEKLRETVQEQRSRTVQANERTAQVKDTMRERLAASAEQNAKLKASVQEQRSRVVQANEKTAQLKAKLSERTLLYQDKLASSREKLLLKSAVYDAARRYYGLYRQGLLFDEIAKSDVDFGADAYLCLLPSTVPAGLMLSRLKGGRVYCDCVENVEVHKHSLAPRIHQPTLGMINLAAHGSLMAVDGIFTVGQALASTLGRFGPPVHVIPNFRRFEEPAPAQELRAACGLTPDDRLLFASGNVVVGFEHVVEAMAQIPANVHLAAFVKLKPVEYETAVLQKIADFGLESRFHFFDFVEYERLASLAADADVGLITSDISNPNGAVALPNRLFDYLTAGLPVIAPPMPDVVDIVQQHGFGKTLAQVTAEDWRAAIMEVLQDRHLLKQAALEARRALTWENEEANLIAALGHPRTVTLIGFRDLSRYQRFLRVAQSLSNHGIRVKALFLADDPAPVRIPGAEYYYFSNRYGLGDGPIRVAHEGELHV